MTKARTKKSVEMLLPTNDFVFKHLFGDAQDTEPLAELLKAVLGLPEKEFARLTVADTNLNREHEDDKLYILDVRVTTSSGKDVDVEIQVRPTEELCDRIQQYVAKMVTEKGKKGEDYENPAQCISIVILEHRLWRKDDKQYHHRFSLYDAGAKLEYPNSMEIHTLELPKIPKNSDGTALWNWLRFISSKTQEEIMPLAEKDPVISKSFGKLMHMSDDLILRRRAEARDKFLWDQAARERQSLREGLKKGMAKGMAKGMEKGMEKGREEGMAEVARRMLRKRMPFTEISDLTGCSLAEIEKLAANRGNG